MKIKIIAIAPNDGWAFIIKEGKIYLLRPPYTTSNQIEVSSKVVENAIHIHDFEECDFTFDSMSEVIGSIKDRWKGSHHRIPFHFKYGWFTPSYTTNAIERFTASYTI